MIRHLKVFHDIWMTLEYDSFADLSVNFLEDGGANENKLYDAVIFFFNRTKKGIKRAQARQNNDQQNGENRFKKYSAKDTFIAFIRNKYQPQNKGRKKTNNPITKLVSIDD